MHFTLDMIGLWMEVIEIEYLNLEMIEIECLSNYVQVLQFI